MSDDRPRSQARKGALLSLTAAALFGASAPLGKILLGSDGERGVSPLCLAALLYLGAGIGLTIARAVRALRRGAGATPSEARIRAADLPLLAGITLAGGVAGPLLLMIGIDRLSAAGASLLLNLEAPITITLAVTLFGEHLTRREAGAAIVLVGSAAAFGYAPSATRGAIDGLGVLAIAGACAGFALDNNLTQRLSLRDPLDVAQAKTLVASACSFAIAFALRSPLPALRLAVPALAVGAVSYGLSLLLTMHAMRILGAARQAAYFSTAPFAGAGLAMVLLGDRLSSLELGAAAGMGLGVALLARASHRHHHAHDAIEHDHEHVHDAHHQHAHDGPISEPHAHLHSHEAMSHDHDHVSDLHHRHAHD